MLGLLSGIEKKNSWWLAEHPFAGPLKMQRLLREAVWDADGVRYDVLGILVVAHLGDPDGVLICDETGFLKKEPRRSRATSIHRHCWSDRKRAGGCVFLAYASPSGRALIDRRIYLPASWSQDLEWCAAAGVPSVVAFATKPRLALDMVVDAVAAQVPARWGHR